MSTFCCDRRSEALKAAIDHHGNATDGATPEVIVKTATAFYEFLGSEADRKPTDLAEVA